MSGANDALHELRAALRADAAAIAEVLLGPPNRALSTKREARWGDSGGISMVLEGPKKGLWSCFNGKLTAPNGKPGGDLISLKRAVRGCSFPDALTWARQWTGIGAEQKRPANDQRRPEPPAPDTDAEDAGVAARIATAQAIVAESVPLAGTLGEHYLSKIRAIPAPAAGWPDVVLFHKGHRALVVVATTADDTVHATQRVHLTPDGSKRGGPNPKRTNGLLAGAWVRLPGPALGPLLIAEGPETGLSVWAVTGFETWITLGKSNISQLPIPHGRRVIICAEFGQVKA